MPILTWLHIFLRRLLSILCLPASFKAQANTTVEEETSGGETNRQTPTTPPHVPVQPRLCPKCRDWDKWSGIFRDDFGMWYEVSCEELLDNHYCLVCRRVLEVVNAQMQHCGDPKSTLESQVKAVHIKGPFYLDQLVAGRAETALQRVDLTDTTNIIIPLWMSIDIELPGPSPPPKPPRDSSSGSNASPRRSIDIFGRRLQSTPLFRAYYRREAKSPLCGLEIWNVPYFDLETVRAWIDNCQANHGDQCGSPHDTSMLKLPMQPPTEPNVLAPAQTTCRRVSESSIRSA